MKHRPQPPTVKDQKETNMTFKIRTALLASALVLGAALSAQAARTDIVIGMQL